MFAGLSRWYKLRRHRLGIGVHSPFAYRVVRDIIYGKGIYYTILKRARLTRGYPRRVRRAYNILFRLVARIPVAGIRFSYGVEPQIEMLLRMADSRPMSGYGLGGYHPGKRILSICDAVDLRKGLPQGIMSSGNIVVARDLDYAPEVRKMLIDAIKGGWVFSDRKMALIVSDDNEPLNLIDVKMV